MCFVAHERSCPHAVDEVSVRKESIRLLPLQSVPATPDPLCWRGDASCCTAERPRGSSLWKWFNVPPSTIREGVVVVATEPVVSAKMTLMG